MHSGRRRLWTATLLMVNVVLLAQVLNAMYILSQGVHLPPDVTTVDWNSPDPDDYRIRYLDPEFLPHLRFWFRDPAFNPPGMNHPERIMRLTDGIAIDVATILHEYSSMTPFNETGSKIALIHQSPVAVYDLNTFEHETLPVLSHALPRWSRTNEHVLYYWPFANGSPVRLFQYDTATGQHSAVGGSWNFNGRTYDRTFNSAGEDDLCFGGDHIVRLVGWNDRTFMVVFSLSAKSVIAEYELTGYAVDSIEIAPAIQAQDQANDRNEILVVTFVNSEERPPDPFGEMGKGIWGFQFDSDAPAGNRITTYAQLNTSNGHHDVGLDNDGSPILVVTNSATFNPVPGCQLGGKGIEKIPIANPDAANRTTSTCLLNGIPWSLAEHISLADQAGWAFVSTFAPSDPLPGSADWTVFTNELMQVRLDGSGEVRRLGHHRSRPSPDGYVWTPRLSASRDGRVIAFTSNFGYGSQPNNNSNVYIIGDVDVRTDDVHTLEASTSGNGTVVSRPSGVYCGTKCSSEFNSGTVVTLRAIPDTGWVFDGWRGQCSGSGPCMLSMTASHRARAMFKRGNSLKDNGPGDKNGQ